MKSTIIQFKKRSFFIFFTFIILVCNFCLFSNEATNESDDNIFEELSLGDILLIELETGSFLELDILKSPLSMTVITHDMIKTSGARHMSELLEIYVPGFQYMYNKWNGTIWGLRGVANDRNTKIIYLVNGHKLNTQARDGFTGEVVLGLLGDIERVEVLRGPAGLVYGSGAISGIINIVTRKADRAESEISAAFGTHDSKEIEGNIHYSLSDKNRLSFSVGLRNSGGLKTHQSRLYGKHSWPYPTDVATEKTGVPSDGNFGSTDGNWKISGDCSISDFNLYFRITHQEENAGGWFIIDPWPEIEGVPDSTAKQKVIDGKTVQYYDPFWSETESWRTNRRKYVSDNIMAEASYSVIFGENEWKSRVGYDRNTTQIGTENRPGYEMDFTNRRSEYIDETFGEARFTVNSMFLIKSLNKVQIAAGLEYRLDHIGDDLDGKNEKAENEKHPIVSEIYYNTFSLFSEGIVYISDLVTAHLGGRLDFHTRAFMINPKLAFILSPSMDHSLKLIFQTSSNNGSADNYEYNRWHFDDNGNFKSEITFERPYVKPTATTDIIQSSPSEDTLHALKPEKVYSLELTTSHKIGPYFQIAPSFSFGMVKDLIGWSQKLFRCINVGEYKYINIEFEGNLKTKMVQCGINHTFQRPVNIDDFKNRKTYKVAVVDATKPGWFKSDTLADGSVKYTPLLTGTENYDINIVKTSITRDNKNFLNLSSHISKFYFTLKPVNWFAFHTNLRLFWGLKGRKPIYDPEVAGGFQYWGIHRGKITKFSSMPKKWNAGIHFFISNDFDLSFFVYDILGTDSGKGTRSENRNVINTLRWQQMAQPEQQGLSSNDQRSFGLRITKKF